MKILILLILLTTTLFYSNNKYNSKYEEKISNANRIVKKQFNKAKNKINKNTLSYQLNNHREQNPPEIKTSKLDNKLCMIKKSYKRPFGLGTYKVYKKVFCHEIQ